jgi:hypothetical protein
MRKFCRLSVLSSAGLALGLLLLPAPAARADLSVDNIGLYAGGSSPIDTGSTIIEVAFTGNSGIWVYGDAQTATNWTYSNGGSVPLYCIDLVHDNYLGSSYPLTSWTNPSSFTHDALNRVAWAAENASLAGFGPAAAQIVMWAAIDPHFQVINWNNDTALYSAYTAFVSTMNSQYNPSANYLSGAAFFDAVHEPSSNLNQDLVVGIPGGDIHINALGAPEPSTLVIAGLGALGLIGYGWRRRRAGSASL